MGGLAISIAMRTTTIMMTVVLLLRSSYITPPGTTGYPLQVGSGIAPLRTGGGGTKGLARLALEVVTSFVGGWEGSGNFGPEEAHEHKGPTNHGFWNPCVLGLRARM